MATYTDWKNRTPNFILNRFCITAPIVNIFDIAKQLDILLFVVPNARWDCSVEVTDNAKIYLNEHISVERQRYGCAHALGHLLLHDNKKTYRDKFDTDIETYDEAEANLFARELLLPSWMLIAYVPRLKYNDLPAYFGCTQKLMARRLKEVGLYANPQ